MSTATVDTDRLAVSLELSTISERFALEATLWKMPEAKAECERVARYLSQLARSALGSGDLAIVTAYAEASSLLIDHIVGTRRFFEQITHKPQVRRR